MGDMSSPSKKFGKEEAPKIQVLSGPSAWEWVQRRTASVRARQADLRCGAPVQVLQFTRYGFNDDSVILIPESCARDYRATEALPFVGSTPAAPASSGYVPPKRTRGERVSRNEQIDIRVARITAREVVLKCMPTRSTHWGVDLGRLKTWPAMTPGSFETCMRENQLEPLEASPDGFALLRGAFAVSAYARADKTRQFRAPRMPVMHNHRDGLRYILSLDGVNCGSPGQVHVLIHPDDIHPRLSGWESPERPWIAEHKPGLRLLASSDNRIRFYQLTAAQWAMWSTNRPDAAAFPEAIRDQALAAIEAAERLRAAQA